MGEKGCWAHVGSAPEAESRQELLAAPLEAVTETFCGTNLTFLHKSSCALSLLRHR